MAKLKTYKPTSDTAQLKLVEGKWKVLVKVDKEDKVFLYSAKKENAIKAFKSKAKSEQLIAWDINVLEVFSEANVFETTVKRTDKTLRKTNTVNVTERQPIVRKPFETFKIKVYGEGTLKGETKTGTVISKSAGNFNVRFDTKMGTIIQSFNNKTGVLKSNNHNQSWKMDLKTA